MKYNKAILWKIQYYCELETG